MKDTTKITLTYKQLKELVKESKTNVIVEDTNFDAVTIHIKMGNDAMETVDNVIDVLDKIVKEMRNTNTISDKKIRDINGNTVGYLKTN